MGARRFPIAFVAGILFAGATLVPAVCLAQENLAPGTVEPKVDLEGCTDLKVVPRLPGSTIASCDKGDSMEVILPLKPDAQGVAREKSVRGRYEFREYRISNFYSQPEQAFENLMRLLPIAGSTVKYSANPSTITARNGDTWILINVSGEYYDVKAVQANEEAWTPVKSAEEISREMEAHRNVAIYGIEFSPDNQTIQEKGPEILNEVLKYLKQNPNLAVVIESHKWSTKGNAEDDLEVTRARANAVVEWLVAHGIPAGRLQSKPFGRSKPLTENDTALEIQRNERIALVKAAS